MKIENIINNLMNHPDSEVRRQAAEDIAMSSVFNDSIAEAMIKGIQDSDNGVKDICSRYLAQLTGSGAYLCAEKLCDLINVEELEIRNLAGDILTKLGAASVEYLIPYLKSPDQDVRKFACDILGLISNNGVLPFIFELIEDGDINVISSAFEAIGNIGSDDGLNLLFENYDKFEDLKNVIIDSVGKIGGSEAIYFLIDKMQSEEDVFLQTACIDALAQGANDISLFHSLSQELPHTQKELQPIMLKTVSAIANRNDLPFILEGELRDIAYRALFDDDADIRHSGLFALGLEYIKEDIPALINEILQNNSETQQFILFNLLNTGTIELIKEFFNEFCLLVTGDGSDLLFISNLKDIKSEIPQENAEALFHILLEMIIRYPKNYSSDMIELLRTIDKDLISKSFVKIVRSGDSKIIDEALELISINRINEVIPYFQDFEDTNSELRKKIILTLQLLQN
ncbi:MAG: HEAT repeat domain-containing protein [Candidatus Kapabacteria bacterium]|nr:HEAT repeat domain-containing protein [Candidatus Kapabacteria bacterium]